MQNLVKRTFTRTLLSLSLMSPLFLAGCASQNYPTNVSPLGSDPYSGYQRIEFAPRWSPSGDRIAIRMYREADTPPPIQSLQGKPSDTISLFDSKTGQILQTWALPFSEDSRQPRLQWADQGDKLYVLRAIEYQPNAGPNQSYTKPKPAGALIQSLMLFTLIPGTEAPAVREIYLPESLKDLSTLRFEYPALSPDGKQLSLMRVSQADERERYELILLDLTGAGIVSRTPLEGKAQQSVAWGKDGELYALTYKDYPGQGQSVLWRVKDQKAEQQYAAWSDQASFILSPDRSHALLSFDDAQARPEGDDQVPAPDSFWQGDRLHLILDLGSGKRNWFRTMPLLEDDPAQEQALERWDRLNRVSYQVNYGSAEPKPPQFKDRGKTWIEIQASGQASSSTGFDLTLPTAEIDKQVRPLLSQSQQATYRLPQPSVAANGPDGRALMSLDQSSWVPSQSANLFYIWDPVKSKLLPLESPMSKLVTPCMGCSRTPYGVQLGQ